MGLFLTVTDKIKSGADWVEKTGEAAVDTTVQSGREAVVATKNAAIVTYDTTKEVAGWAKDQAVAGAKMVENKAIAAAEWTKDQAVTGAVWAKDKAVAGAKKTLKVVKTATDVAVGYPLDEVVAGVGILAAMAATANKSVESCLLDLVETPEKDKKNNPNDGKFIGPDCPETSPIRPEQGRLPDGCQDRQDASRKMPKILYMNGINTDQQAACATITAIANTRCAEVTGIYNDTKGIKNDLLDCRNNIDRARQEPAAHTQAAYLAEMLMKDPSEPVTIYAHSQGGLITQEGLSEAQQKIFDLEYANLKNENQARQATGLEPYSYEELEKTANQRTQSRMSNVTVYSFGTAVYDWPPVGAHLHQFTNTSDPVPKVITSVQLTRGKVSDELKRRKANKQPMNHLDESEFFTNPFLNPIDAHNMDNVYLPELEKLHPTLKQPNGKCC